MLNRLREQFGTKKLGVWTVSLSAEPPDALPVGWYEDETVLGDLLRAVQEYERNDQLPRDMEDDLGNGSGPLAAELLAMLKKTNRQQRQQLLRRVAITGVDFLRGHRVLSEENEEQTT